MAAKVEEAMSEDNESLCREFCRTAGKAYAKEFANKLRDLCPQNTGLDLNECNLKLIIRLFTQEFAQYLQQELNISSICDNNKSSNNNIKATNNLKHELDFGSAVNGVVTEDRAQTVSDTVSETSTQANGTQSTDVSALPTDANQLPVPSAQTSLASESTSNGVNHNIANSIDTNVTPVVVNASNITRITTTNGSHAVTVRPKSTAEAMAQHAATGPSQTATHDDYSDLSDNDNGTESPKTHNRKFFRRFSFKGLRKGWLLFVCLFLY